MALNLNIQTGSHTPIYRQIIDQVRRAVAVGELAVGEQLPSVRRLAERLVINPNTVARAYGDLIRDGVLNGRGGKGVFVAEPRGVVFSDAERQRRLDAALDALVSEAIALQADEAEIIAALRAKLDQIRTGRPS